MVPASAKDVTPTIVDAPKAVISGPMMRKKELVDAVVTRSGMKKKDVKPVVETMLAVLGDALRDNRELNLTPFGRLRVRREKSFANGRMVVAKIRQPNPPSTTETDASDTDV
ncbi:MAG: HU family DNA-binding protein [Sulfitobacter sp.]